MGCVGVGGGDCEGAGGALGQLDWAARAERVRPAQVVPCAHELHALQPVCLQGQALVALTPTSP